MTARHSPQSRNHKSEYFRVFRTTMT